jgi:hypothetical protein
VRGLWIIEYRDRHCVVIANECLSTVHLCLCYLAMHVISVSEWKSLVPPEWTHSCRPLLLFLLHSTENLVIFSSKLYVNLGTFFVLEVRSLGHSQALRSRITHKLK